MITVTYSLLNGKGSLPVEACVIVVTDVFQEWEVFTGMIVADVKDGAGRDIPSWVDPDRAPDVALLKVGMTYCPLK